jgi:Tol biopolymer transport system component
MGGYHDVKNSVVCLAIFLLAIPAASSNPQDTVLHGTADPYLGQEPPGSTPVIFAPGIVSREDIFEHSSLYLTPDLNEMYWIADSMSASNRKLMYVQYANGSWSSPNDAAICRQYANSNLSFSADGMRLYFSSRISLDGSDGLKDSDIWYVDRQEGKWGEPTNLGLVINSDRIEALGMVLHNGTVYFSDYHDIYRSNMVNGEYEQPVKLGAPINTDYFDLAPYVAEDESYLLFESNRPKGMGGTDLYISYKTGDGFWTEPQNLGSDINTAGHERSPYVSPDGKYLFFWRVTDGSDIFWVDARIIDDLRPEK